VNYFDFTKIKCLIKVVLEGENKYISPDNDSSLPFPTFVPTVKYDVLFVKSTPSGS